ncbi:MAG: hypothetical protein HC852_02935 [Acaryochloridaceae cyanobacterium RU_4_10]|nr:hypothetical protein [Acaryochloridaceae cyanobacterium RU_4_10]
MENLTEILNNEINDENVKSQIKDIDLKAIIQQTIQRHQNMWEEVCRAFIRLKVQVLM